MSYRRRWARRRRFLHAGWRRGISPSATCICSASFTSITAQGVVPVLDTSDSKGWMQCSIRCRRRALEKAYIPCSFHSTNPGREQPHLAFRRHHHGDRNHPTPTPMRWMPAASARLALLEYSSATVHAVCVMTLVRGSRGSLADGSERVGAWEQLPLLQGM